MKIIITGSLGYVSTPLIKELINKGHSIVVISSNAERITAIESLGAKAAIGTMQDVDFLTKTFIGADAVYCMISPGGSFTDPENSVNDVINRAEKIAINYLTAISQSGIQRVVYLSSIGAHTNKGVGMFAFHYNAENILKKLPPTVSITFVRPVAFYKNLFGFLSSIKEHGVIASNYGEADKLFLVSPIDLAAVITEEIISSTVGRSVRYVASEELTCNEVASILGKAIGKPDLKWIIISDELLLNRLKSSGMNSSFAESFVLTNGNTHKGTIYEDYYRNRPTLGKIKLTDFTPEFTAFYQKT